VWAKSRTGQDDATTGLVTAGGNLYWFSADGSAHGRIEWPGRPGRITAVAVAPDAHRVAVLADGVLFVAALSTSGDGAQIVAPRRIRTQLADPSALDWNSETVLVVAGKRPDSGRVAIMEVSIDGATQSDRSSELGTNAVTYLAALPANPARGEESGAIAYVLGGAAYDEVHPEIGVDDLAERVTDPPAGVQPANPFFLN
jgi:hypothetical protein